jgi:hypothetical protein
MYVSVEEPLYQDGPPSGIQDAVNYARIIKIFCLLAKINCWLLKDLIPGEYYPIQCVFI